MNKKQQLYIKNEKGRYEPYKPKKPEPSDTLYKKVGKKYVPFAKQIDLDYLTDGVYVVRADKRGNFRSLIEQGLANEVFIIEKVSDNYRITTEQIASLQDYEDFAWAKLNEFKRERENNNFGISNAEKVEVIIGSVFQFSQILKEKMENEKTQKRSPSDDYPQF